MITVTPITMTGIFAKLADDFIALKRAQGYKYYSEAKVLGRFCRFAEKYPLETPSLSKELIEDWTSPREGEAKKSRMHRITCLNQFGKYLTSLGYTVSTVPKQSRWGSNSFTPYIFTHDEISQIFKASDNVRAFRCRNSNKAFPMLIRLLYSCGLRVSEAVHLRCGDVDLQKGMLTIREAKNGCDRLIPLSQSLLVLFREYRDTVIPCATDDGYLFTAPDRTILSPNTVYQKFRQIMWNGGIPYKGKGNGPRQHDLRHPYVKPALKILSDFFRRGLDVYWGYSLFGTFHRVNAFQFLSRHNIHPSMGWTNNQNRSGLLSHKNMGQPSSRY